ncbi:MAG: oxidoreductase [Betaproteobacteria bacterium]|nr:PDR/VanB family oxidoreductase [Betaproteobacteria bacterium]MBU6512589.1 PDR/VanB family oxidoreductase [Betaproteobacteria bacterium]MDE1955400.1 oxidoreductase [Betaproteobacteria bacterium]MDE2152935.1 oxidoreductase [Betaproteobacteria bacterium]
MLGQTGIEVEVRGLRALARDVLEFELARVDGAPLEPAVPGAHVDLVVDPPTGGAQLRQYSITNAGTQARLDSYRIAVARAADGRGGSAWLHDTVRRGTRLRMGSARHLFSLADAARPALFIAGGIGITPLLAMARAAAAAGADWRLVYLVRSEERAAYLDELLELDAGRVSLHVSGPLERRLDLAALLRRLDDGTHVYCCGPQGLMQAVRELGAGRPPGTLHFESFGAAADASAAPAPDRGFELRLARSGLHARVPPGSSVLEVIEQLGIAHPSSCREGICGSCELRVLDGACDHRDQILEAHERGDGGRFFPCVSRCTGDSLTLDL